MKSCPNCGADFQTGFGPGTDLVRCPICSREDASHPMNLDSARRAQQQQLGVLLACSVAVAFVGGLGVAIYYLFTDTRLGLVIGAGVLGAGLELLCLVGLWSGEKYEMGYPPVLKSRRAERIGVVVVPILTLGAMALAYWWR